MSNQVTYIELNHGLIHVEIPNEEKEVVSGVKWGKAIAFPSVAYWYYKVISSRFKKETVKYKLGRSLAEELGACLLGGHGIPASAGINAYEHMKELGAFNGECHSEATLYDWLSQPIYDGKKHFKYRFAKQKAHYLYHALTKINAEEAPEESGKQLRNWLLDIKGVGLKTASWVARNWMDADDVAILDIHILRAGLLGGFFNESMKVEKDYLQMEMIFVELAQAMDVQASELDAIIWYEMQSNPNVRKLLESRANKTSYISRGSASYESGAYTRQLSFI